jgi:5-methylcytosine-specific restriction protein A
MPVELGIEEVRQRLEGRFGLRLLSVTETIDGGVFPTIRPSDLEVGNGFCIVLARTHRQLEASFRADNFAAGLLRRMAEADEQSRQTFRVLLEQTRIDGAQVYVAVNGASADPLPTSSDSWQRFELDVTCRLPAGRLSPEIYAEKALFVASVCLTLSLALLPVEETGSTTAKEALGLPEGARIRIEVNRYERSPVNRAACISHFGTSCSACGFSFGEAYGVQGEGYVEVHHRYPVSQMGADYFVNPVRDLVTVCSNCHSMLHRTNPPMTVEDLKTMLDARHPNRTAPK